MLWCYVELRSYTVYLQSKSKYIFGYYSCRSIIMLILWLQCWKRIRVVGANTSLLASNKLFHIHDSCNCSTGNQICWNSNFSVFHAWQNGVWCDSCGRKLADWLLADLLTCMHTHLSRMPFGSIGQNTACGSCMQTAKYWSRYHTRRQVCFDLDLVCCCIG